MTGLSASRTAGRHAGFSMVEVLIALLVVAVGALAIGRFSSVLARQADAARHRTEAVLLAQAKLDELRSDAQLAEAGASPAASASGSDEPAAASNTRFVRRWHVMGASMDLHRLAEVRVDWTDRDGTADEAGVRLKALIARTDPTDAGRLALSGGSAAAVHQPLGRSATIPWEATRLSGANRGRSVLRWGTTASVHLVFDDASGQIVQQCDSPVGDGTDVTASCTPIDALLLSGYLSGDGASGALDIAFERLAHAVAVPVCHIGTAVAPDGQPMAGVRAYRCLMRPGDHDGNAGTPRVWSGRAVVLPQPAAPRAVCRYTTDAAPDGGPPRNEDHPADYTEVSRSLQHQNFALTSGGPCPDGSVVHQPE